MAEQKKILLIYTGGTIGMVEDPATGQLRPFDFAHLSAQVPELSRFDIRISCISSPEAIDSSNMTPGHWSWMANVIAENYSFYDGFVILHGSDTIAYTASALSFMLENLGKPVILTGSQLPIGTIRTDGKENLITSIQIAADAGPDGKPVVPEVAVYFEYTLFRGNRTHKYNAEHFRAIHSPNYPELATAGVHIRYNHSAIMSAAAGPFSVQPVLCPDLAILKMFPGISPAAVHATLRIPGLRGLVLETFGAGNATTAGWFIDALSEATRNGLVILNVTQCQAGMVQQGRYQTSALLGPAGVIGGSDISTEAALAKMMYLFGKGLTANEARALLPVPIRGELSSLI